MPLFAIRCSGSPSRQVGIVRHWRRERGRGSQGEALLNGFGGLLTGVSAVVVTATKFEEGAWLVVVALPLLVAAFWWPRAPRFAASASSLTWAVSRSRTATVRW